MIHLLSLLLVSVFADTCFDALSVSVEYKNAQSGLMAFESVKSSLSKKELVVLEAAKANLTKHETVFRKDRRGKELARHLKIQKLIAKFNLREIRWSIYQIKRAIEERFYIKEYVECE